MTFIEAFDAMKSGKRVKINKCIFWIEGKNYWVAQRYGSSPLRAKSILIEKVMSDEWELA